MGQNFAIFWPYKNWEKNKNIRTVSIISTAWKNIGEALLIIRPGLIIETSEYDVKMNEKFIFHMFWRRESLSF